MKIARIVVLTMFFISSLAYPCQDKDAGHLASISLFKKRHIPTQKDIHVRIGEAERGTLYKRILDSISRIDISKLQTNTYPIQIRQGNGRIVTVKIKAKTFIDPQLPLANAWHFTARTQNDGNILVISSRIDLNISKDNFRPDAEYRTHEEYTACRDELIYHENIESELEMTLPPKQRDNAHILASAKTIAAFVDPDNICLTPDHRRQIDKLIRERNVVALSSIVRESRGVHKAVRRRHFRRTPQILKLIKKYERLLKSEALAGIATINQTRYQDIVSFQTNRQPKENVHKFYFGGYEFILPETAKSKIRIESLYENNRATKMRLIDKNNPANTLTITIEGENVVFHEYTKIGHLSRHSIKFLPDPKSKVRLRETDVSALARFTDLLFDIPSAQPAKRKNAIFNYLQSNFPPTAFPKTGDCPELNLKGIRLMLPRLGENSPDLIYYRDSEKAVRFAAIADAKDPSNFIAFEVKEDAIYLVGSHRKITISPTNKKERRPIYLSRFFPFRALYLTALGQKKEKTFGREDLAKVNLGQNSIKFRFNGESCTVKKVGDTHTGKLLVEIYNDVGMLITTISSVPGSEDDFYIEGIKPKPTGKRGRPLKIRIGETYTNLSRVIDKIRRNEDGFGDFLICDQKLLDFFAPPIRERTDYSLVGNTIMVRSQSEFSDIKTSV